MSTDRGYVACLHIHLGSSPIDTRLRITSPKEANHVLALVKAKAFGLVNPSKFVLHVHSAAGSDKSAWLPLFAKKEGVWRISDAALDLFVGFTAHVEELRNLDDLFGRDLRLSQEWLDLGYSPVHLDELIKRYISTHQ